MMDKMLYAGENIIGGADGPTAVFWAGEAVAGISVASLVIGILICFLGLKLVRVMAVAVGFLAGAGAGAGAVAALDAEGALALVMVLGCAVFVAVLSGVLYRFGVFCMSFVYIAILGFIIPGVISGTAGGLSAGTVSGAGFIVVLAIALAGGILTAIFMEPLVIIVTGLHGGMTAGSAAASLLGISGPAWPGSAAGLAVALAGMAVQFMMQSRKIGRKQKVHSKEVKKKASVESEVEKARIILVDDEEEE